LITKTSPERITWRKIMDSMLDIYLQYEMIMDSQRNTIKTQQELIKQLTTENINLKQMIYEETI